MRTRVLFGLGLCVAFLGACSGNDHPNTSVAPMPVAQTPQALDSAQVLALAQRTSETASPFAVNGGLITFTDTSETTSPITVDGM
ncbi:MAG: hypothetical protein ABSC32_08130 [Steroidobacteraceae bacterium]|jgi:hypothetical protein